MKRFTIAIVCFLFFMVSVSCVFAASEKDVYAKNGMVSSAHRMASQAGIEIMKKGGNAVDAAVATSIALSVVEGHFTGIGGGGFMTIRDAESEKVTFLDYREMAPAGATKDMFDSDRKVFYPSKVDAKKWKSVGGKTAGVPGWVSGMFYALEKYGTMSFAEVAKPAIRMAILGWEVEPNQAYWYEYMGLPLVDLYKSKDIPLFNGDFPYQAGEYMTRMDLAKTYQLLAEKGPDVFYKGEIGEAFVKEVQRLGGVMTMEDLENYKLYERKPTTGSYHGYKIFSAPPASSGGTHIVQVLNILENFPMKKWTPISPERQHVTAEAVRLMFADRQKYMADSDFTNVPLKGLVNKNYAKKIAQQIDIKKTMESVQAGNPWEYEEKKVAKYFGGQLGLGSSTSHFSVADAEGNIVACTNTHNYAAGFVPGYGVIINNEMADFSSDPESVNAPEPGKRPLSSMSPTIILSPNGKPFMTVGSAGGWRILTALVQIITNVIDYDMSMAEAIDHPRLFTYTYDGKPAAYIVEDKMLESTLKILEALGEKVDVRKFGDYFGTSQGIIYKNGMMNGGADCRRLGVPVGY